MATKRPMPMADLVRVAERFWARVDVGAPDACWLWTSPMRSDTGYGRYSVGIGGRKSQQFGAHRIAYALANSVDPGQKDVDHLCRVRLCCNPAHLEAVTPAENNARAWAATPAAPEASIEERPSRTLGTRYRVIWRPDGKHKASRTFATLTEAVEFRGHVLRRTGRAVA